MTTPQGIDGAREPISELITQILAEEIEVSDDTFKAAGCVAVINFGNAVARLAALPAVVGIEGRADLIGTILANIEDGLNVHRWLDLWRSDGRKIDTAVAIGFYHQALQDAHQMIEEIALARHPHQPVEDKRANDLPEIDESLHSPEVIASLQKCALALPAVVGIEGREVLPDIPFKIWADKIERTTRISVVRETNCYGEEMRQAHIDCFYDFEARRLIALLRALARHPHQPVEDKREPELFAAVTEIDLAAAVSHLRDWVSYIDDHHRRKYADLLEAQANLIAWFVQSKDALAHPLEPATEAGEQSCS